ncbi:MAG: hypothetical protein DWH87_05155 [Planctomycetota bacterium]|nr:MAG: hypothetical protein DWH87_05155 [Planctomycetota bacterium]
MRAAARFVPRPCDTSARFAGIVSAIAGREDALTIGRLAAIRLREILGSPHQGNDGAGRE